MSVNQVSPPQLKLMKPPEKLEKEKEKLQILRVFPGESLQTPCSTFRTAACWKKSKLNRKWNHKLRPRSCRSLNSPRTSSCLIGGTARSSFGSITEQTNTKVASLLQVLVSVPLQRQKLRDDWNYDISICSIDAHSCSQKKIRVKKKEIWALDWSSCKTDFVDYLSFTNMRGAHVKVRREWTRMEKRDFLESWASISFSSLSAA